MNIRPLYLFISFIAILIVFSISMYFIGNWQGKLSANDSQIKKELVQTRKERDIYKHNADSSDALLRFTFKNNKKKHQKDSIVHAQEKISFLAQLKNLKYDKTNRNFRVVGLDSTITVLTNFIPEN